MAFGVGALELAPNISADRTPGREGIDDMSMGRMALAVRTVEYQSFGHTLVFVRHTDTVVPESEVKRDRFRPIGGVLPFPGGRRPIRIKEEFPDPLDLFLLGFRPLALAIFNQP